MAAGGFVPSQTYKDLAACADNIAVSDSCKISESIREKEVGENHEKAYLRRDLVRSMMSW